MTDLPTSAPRTFTLSDFDFALPPERIAQHPASERSASRLLDGRGQPPVDRIFKDLPSLLQPGDLLVFNDTRVVKARLFGEKASGGKLELLIERVLPGGQGNEVVAHMKVSKKPQSGSTIHMAGGRKGGGFDATLLSRWPDDNGPLFRFALHGPTGESPWELMERHGHLPLPPYIERQQNSGNDPDAAQDSQRYQTVFARAPGA
ncbi:MAG TPA: S-adenosylmethionine:tRNA ribosyltransferase-isomerase, partial [Giesbergeria sp.]|nr:S-adenosylmethionine:tRNA ribosyltransferase-isomerase [Giesbergeria sp.]